jgi:hypothetical protein
LNNKQQKQKEDKMAQKLKFRQNGKYFITKLKYLQFQDPQGSGQQSF